ncbi:MAG: hypothetical protein LBL32_02780 [Holosporales bacterium]|nr:hypothetical protein [Holosporales bacterium]
MNRPSIIACLQIIFNMGMCLSREFATYQLPLSEALQKTFPAINSQIFIIVNLESRVVLHGKNFGRESQDKESLYDICVNVEDDLLSKPDDRRIIIFQDRDGYGCIFCYKNPDSCTFLCVFGRAKSRQNIVRDINFIRNWLDQFYLYEVSRRGELIATIPVLYGKVTAIPVVLSKRQLILLSKNCDDNVTKTSRYRTIVAAPIRDGDIVGLIFYGTSTFQNVLSQDLKASTTVEKTNIARILFDSIRYLIFGPKMGA